MAQVNLNLTCYAVDYYLRGCIPDDRNWARISDPNEISIVESIV